jgi:SAM-dependent methyltransferase
MTEKLTFPLRGRKGWNDIAREYEAKVFSVTSFPAKREQVLQAVSSGLVVDLGCGPLGLMIRELAQIPQICAVGTDFCSAMIAESRRHTEGLDVYYLLADNRCLPFRSASIDTIVSINSFVPETRAEVELMFAEASRVLRKKGRLVTVLPSFEMSLVARDRWGMAVRLDLQDRREWDTLGWQCFYTTSDIEHLMHAHHFEQYRSEKMIFSAPEELAHIKQIYADGLQGVPQNRLTQYPLFEHLLIAER